MDAAAKLVGNPWNNMFNLPQDVEYTPQKTKLIRNVESYNILNHPPHKTIPSI